MKNLTIALFAACFLFAGCPAPADTTPDQPADLVVVDAAPDASVTPDLGAADAALDAAVTAD